MNLQESEQIDQHSAVILSVSQENDQHSAKILCTSQENDQHSAMILCGSRIEVAIEVSCTLQHLQMPRIGKAIVLSGLDRLPPLVKIEIIENVILPFGMKIA